MTNLNLVNNETETTNSKIVAEYFGKEHRNILQKIDNLLKVIPTEFAELNFQLCFNINELQNGKKNKSYNLTKDGFLMVAMSLTGPKAVQWKIAFINEFNRIEQQNRKLKDVVWSVIEGKAFLGQEMGCKCAGIKKPRKFIQLLRENEEAFELLQEKGRFTYRRVGDHQSDMAWCWSKEGFKWLLKRVDHLNSRVDELIKIEEKKKKN